MTKKIQEIDFSTIKPEGCPRFFVCPINKCPIDYEAKSKKELPGEEKCPWTIKKRTKRQKGMKLLAPDSALKVIPELNVKMLNKRNLKRWHILYSEIHRNYTNKVKNSEKI